MFLYVFFFFFFFNFLYKAYVVDTGCNLKTAELPECALIGACAVIRSNTVVSPRGLNIV